MGWLWFNPLIYIGAGIVALISAYLILRNENRNPGARSLSIMLLLAAEWVFGLALSTVSHAYATKIFWVKFHFIGVAYTGITWFFSINQYIQGDQWLSSRKLILFSIAPTLAILLMLTNPYHGLIYQSYSLNQYGHYQIITPTYGTALWIFFAFNISIILIGGGKLIGILGRSWWSFRINGFIMFIGTSAPVIVLLLQIFKPALFGPLKPTSLAIILAGMTTAFGLDKVGRQKIVSVSRHELFDRIKKIILVADLQNRVVDMNKEAERVFERTLTKTIGQTINTLLPQLDEIDLNKENPCLIEIDQPDVCRSYECTLVKMLNWEARPVNHIYILRDISHRVQMEQRIISSLQEKETLLREIHHRAKNNLQVISSIFNLQSALIESKQIRALFLESKERIQAIALVHEKLYLSEGVNYIDFSDYVHSLIEMLIPQNKKTLSTISIDIQVDGIQIPYDLATPCGLIVYELISNAFKHAFPSKMSGMIQIICQKQPDNHLLINVRDNGVALPKHINITDSKTLGFQLINALILQTQGLIEIDRSPGTCIEIVIPMGNNL